MAGLGKVPRIPRTATGVLSSESRREASMSGRVVVHVRENLPEDWPWHLRAFAMLLASYYDEKLGYAWPGMKTLAHDTKKDKSQIREWLRDDRLKSEINYVEGRGQGNKSKFFFPNVPWVAKEDTK